MKKKGTPQLPGVGRAPEKAPAKKPGKASANLMREAVTAPFGRKTDVQETNAKTMAQARASAKQQPFGASAVGIMPLKSLQR